MNEDSVTSRAALGHDPSNLTQNSERAAIEEALNRAAPNHKDMTYDIKKDKSATYGPNYDEMPQHNSDVYSGKTHTFGGRHQIDDVDKTEGGAVLATTVAALAPILIPIVSKGIRKFIQSMRAKREEKKAAKEEKKTKAATEGKGYLGTGFLGRGQISHHDETRIIKSIHKMAKVLEDSMQEDIDGGRISTGHDLFRRIVKDSRQIGRNLAHILGPQIEQVLEAHAKGSFVGSGLHSGRFGAKRGGSRMDGILSHGRLIFPHVHDALKPLKRHLKGHMALEDLISGAFEEDPRASEPIKYRDLIHGHGFFGNLRNRIRHGFEMVKQSGILKKIASAGLDGIEEMLDALGKTADSKIAKVFGDKSGSKEEKLLKLAKIADKTTKKLKGSGSVKKAMCLEEATSSSDDESDSDADGGAQFQPIIGGRANKKKPRAAPRRRMAWE
jgi:hypothetical protein